MCVRTVRETNIFEEVTVHYGTGYFHEAMLCRCGEPNCSFDTVDKVRAATFQMVSREEREKFLREAELQRR